MPFDVTIRAATLAEAYNRVYDAKLPELVRPLVEAGLQGLERNPAEGTILVGVSGHICEGKLTPPVDTVIAVTVQRLPPPPAFEDAPESVAEQPAEAAEDPPAPEGEPAPEAPRRRRRAPA